VSKRIDAPSRSGNASDWIKVKCVGWRDANKERCSTGRLAPSLAALSGLSNGNSIRVGEWIDRKHGTWLLRIEREDFGDDGKDKGRRGGKARARALSAKKRVGDRQDSSRCAVAGTYPCPTHSHRHQPERRPAWRAAALAYSQARATASLISPRGGDRSRP